MQCCEADKSCTNYDGASVLDMGLDEQGFITTIACQTPWPLFICWSPGCQYHGCPCCLHFDDIAIEGHMVDAGTTRGVAHGVPPVASAVHADEHDMEGSTADMKSAGAAGCVNWGGVEEWGRKAGRGG